MLIVIVKIRNMIIFFVVMLLVIIVFFNVVFVVFFFKLYDFKLVWKLMVNIFIIVKNKFVKG